MSDNNYAMDISFTYLSHNEINAKRVTQESGQHLAASIDRPIYCCQGNDQSKTHVGSWLIFQILKCHGMPTSLVSHGNEFVLQ